MVRSAGLEAGGPMYQTDKMLNIVHHATLEAGTSRDSQPVTTYSDLAPDADPAMFLLLGQRFPSLWLET